MNTLEIIIQKANFLNNLSNSENALFEYINNNQENLVEVIHQYKPEREFRPVNTLRFLIANELKKGTLINSELIEQLKQVIESRDVSSYYNLNDVVKQSLTNYKNSKVGMFPNWRHAFKILFPFIHNASENEEVKTQLNQLADNIIQENQLKNVAKHIVSFQGSQNYGSDRVWVAIIPKSAPSVQYAYQIFFNIGKNGLVGGVHKGHNLVKQTFNNQDDSFQTWESYLSRTKAIKEEWSTLNSNIDFIIINDEKSFQKTLKKVDENALNTYFNTLDNLIEDLEIQDEEKLVFSVSSNQLSFHVGKRYCLNVKKNVFDFITYNEIEGSSLDKETFSEPNLAYLYRRSEASHVIEHYEDIKNAVDIEIGRDNHALAKTYDNSAFRKAVFDKEYRKRFFKNNQVLAHDRSYWALGFNSNTERLERFKNEGYWQALDYAKDTSRKPAIRARKLFSQIQSGDYIIIKGYGGSHDLVVHYKAEVISKDNETERLELKKLDGGGHYKGKAPSGSGAGNWHETILQIKREEDINLLFGESMENVKKEFINWLTNKPKSKYFNNDKDTLNRFLDSYNSYFDINIFEISKSNYKSIINTIHKVAYLDENNAFFRYSQGESTHRPRAILGKTNYYQFLEHKFNKTNKNAIQDLHYKAPINQIFYGPPGTGKTFYLKDKLFNKYTTKQTSITSDQHFETVVSNCSWWQVIAIALLDMGKSKVSDIFENEWVKKKASLSNSKTIRPTLWGQLQNHTINECEHVNVSNRLQPLIFNKTEDSYWEILEEEVEELVPELYDIKKSVDDYNPDPDKVIKHYDFVTFHQSFAYEDFIEGIKPVFSESDDEFKDLGYKVEDGVFKQLCLKAKNNPDNRYAIFIDEINRGNVSAIFGELITLIETDKRQGAKNEMRIKLPYSKTEFSVPSNLDIYGTMNTADRSVEALDTALRRRFMFKEMMPDYNVIENEEVSEVKLKNVLETINQRIELLIDRDHTIGHSYFVGVNSEEKLASAFNNKIVPLLQEYFYGDYGKIGLVLGKGFVKRKKNDQLKFSSFKYEGKDEFIAPSFILKQIDASNIIEAINQMFETK